MLDKHYDLCDRTKRFALRILKLCDCLPITEAGRAIGRQLNRRGTSVAAIYRATSSCSPDLPITRSPDF